MSFSEKDIDLIDGHLNGQLNSIEKESFNKKLRNQTEFADLFETVKLAREGLRRTALKKDFFELQKLEQSLPSIEREEMDRTHERETGASRWLRKWSVAAGFLLMFLAGSYFFMNNSSSPEEVYQQYFQAYPNMETERGLLNIGTTRTTESNNPEKNAFTFYDAQNYTAAIKAFNVLKSIDKQPKHNFFLGVAYLANDQATEAIKVFQELKKTPSEYDVRIDWYMALAYLKTGEVDQAKLILQKITKEPNARSYKEKALAILEQL